MRFWIKWGDCFRLSGAFSCWLSLLIIVYSGFRISRNTYMIVYHFCLITILLFLSYVFIIIYYSILELCI